MKDWKRICHFAHGVVYASGNERKLVIPSYPEIFFDTDTKEVRWRPDNGNGRAARQNRIKQSE